MGSWEEGDLGQGQTMSGWNTESNSSASWVSQALVSLFTISLISAASCQFFLLRLRRRAHSNTASILGYSSEGVEGEFRELRPKGVLRSLLERSQRHGRPAYTRSAGRTRHCGERSGASVLCTFYPP